MMTMMEHTSDFTSCWEVSCRGTIKIHLMEVLIGFVSGHSTTFLSQLNFFVVCSRRTFSGWVWVSENLKKVQLRQLFGQNLAVQPSPPALSVFNFRSLNPSYHLIHPSLLLIAEHRAMNPSFLHKDEKLFSVYVWKYFEFIMPRLERGLCNIVTSLRLRQSHPRDWQQME